MNKYISWLGTLLIIIGVSLVIYWGIKINGVKNEPDPTYVLPSATKIPDLLVPTRTPILDIIPNNTETSTILLTMTPTMNQTLTPTSTPNTPSPTVTNDNIAPDVRKSVTPTQFPTVFNTSTPTLIASATAKSTVIATPPVPQPVFMIPKEQVYRLGVSLPFGAQRDYKLETLGVGWVMDWRSNANPSLPPGIEYVQTVSLRNEQLTPDASTLSAIAGIRRGSTWLISNEPDVRWQDNVVPETYARLYHEAYNAITGSDPNAIVAAGGIAQPSQLRFTYLDRVLAAYQSLYGVSMPVHAWHIHNYMLREEYNTWGIDIPPGISAQTGVLYGIEDSGNITAFKSQIYEFRRWMVNHGYGGLPLIVSEFGIPMPPDYGYELPRVSEFLRETWYFFYTASDTSLGNPADGGRLVQRWCWFSLGVESYPSGNLLVPPAGDWTSLADVWRDMVEQ